MAELADESIVNEIGKWYLNYRAPDLTSFDIDRS